MPCYVCKGAKLKCSMGSSNSELGVVHPVKAVHLHGKNMASITDHKPVINIKPFGKCKSLANPVVAAATAAASGKLQEMPCIPNTIAPWVPGKLNVLVKGKPALTDDCKCMCVWAGVIKVADAGQKTVKTGTAAAGKMQNAETKSKEKKTTKQDEKPAIGIDKEILMTAGMDMLKKKAGKKSKVENSEQETETVAAEQKPEIVYKLGDVGKVVFEINMRLSGFGGMLPTEEFTELTKKGVEQFQRDYMKMPEPTGVVDNDTLDAIEEFSEKWCENLSDYSCLCNASGSKVKQKDRCSGYGKGLKNERPGIHRSLLWGMSALKYYFSQQTEYKFRQISAGYRCTADNEAKGRPTINHMGSAVDMQFNYNNGKVPVDKSKIDRLKKIRDEFFIKFLNAVEGWAGRKNSYRLEPIGTGENESYSWIHMDVVKFENKYKTDEFFVKEQSSVKGATLQQLSLPNNPA